MGMNIKASEATARIKQQSEDNKRRIKTYFNKKLGAGFKRVGAWILAENVDEYKEMCIRLQKPKSPTATQATK